MKGKSGNMFIDAFNVLWPNKFKRAFLHSYNTHLHEVLINDRIVSTFIKSFSRDEREILSLGSQIGYKFNYDELKNWNFGKSPYYVILSNYFKSKLKIYGLFIALASQSCLNYLCKRSS